MTQKEGRLQKYMNSTDNKILDFQLEATKRNAPEILKELYKRHKETGECGIYKITPDGKLGEKLRNIKG